MRLLLLSRDVMGGYLAGSRSWKLRTDIAVPALVGLGDRFAACLDTGNIGTARSMIHRAGNVSSTVNIVLDIGLGSRGPTTLPIGLNAMTRRIKTLHRTLRGVDYSIDVFIEDHVFNLARHVPSGAVKTNSVASPSWQAMVDALGCYVHGPIRVDIWNCERRSEFRKHFYKDLGLEAPEPQETVETGPIRASVLRSLDRLGWSADDLDDQFQAELCNFHKYGLLKFS